jgi:exopolyphosphatase / guanosine-5'-triphosphate,3'-diphosphate pyrophosphatase
MRLGILDVGSNTVHLLVVDAESSTRPMPAANRRWDSPLLPHLDATNAVTEAGQRELLDVISQARTYASELDIADFSACATSAFRDATNADQLLLRIRQEAGVDLHILDGDDEARLTFLAARRWFGWGSGQLLVLDIGGGSLEMAIGTDEAPVHERSLPLGAARLTRDYLPGDPPHDDDVRALRTHVASTLSTQTEDFLKLPVDMAVGTSKTLRSLARLAGAAPSNEGPYVRRILRRSDTEKLVNRLARLKVSERAKLPGVSVRRAPQLLAGAIVASTTMAHLAIDELSICPWALREGIILTRHDWIALTEADPLG